MKWIQLAVTYLQFPIQVCFSAMVGLARSLLSLYSFYECEFCAMTFTHIVWKCQWTSMPKVNGHLIQKLLS